MPQGPLLPDPQGRRVAVAPVGFLSLTAAALRSAACAGAPQGRRVAVAPVAPRPSSKKHTAIGAEPTPAWGAEAKGADAPAR